MPDFRYKKGHIGKCSLKCLTRGWRSINVGDANQPSMERILLQRPRMSTTDNQRHKVTIYVTFFSCLSLIRSAKHLSVTALLWRGRTFWFCLKRKKLKPHTATEVCKALKGDDALQRGMMPSQLTVVMTGCLEAIRWLQRLDDLSPFIVGLGLLYLKTTTSPKVRYE